jgi:hypothetical protein
LCFVGLPGIGVSSLEHVKKLLAKARCCVASRAGGEECEEYWKYFECSESFPAQAITQYRSRQEFLNML